MVNRSDHGRYMDSVMSHLTRSVLVAGFVHFAREAGFELIAEGIETQEDRDELRLLGVGLGQGFLLGRPARAQDWVVGSGRVGRRAPGSIPRGAAQRRTITTRLSSPW